MDNVPDWLNAFAASAAAIFSYLAWRGAVREPKPEALISSATHLFQEDAEPYAEVHLSVRNLTQRTLFVTGISFAPTGVALEVAQGFEYDAGGGRGASKDFRGNFVENVNYIIRPAGTPRGAVSCGDTAWITVCLRFSAQVPEYVTSSISYSYGSPARTKRIIETNPHKLVRRDVPPPMFRMVAR